MVDGLAGGLSFDAAYEAFQDELLSTRSPELERALRRGFGLDELREACELLHEYRYLRPLRIPAHHDGDLAAHLARVPPHRRCAARAHDRMRARTRTGAWTSPRGSSSGSIGSRPSRRRPSRSSCSCTGTPAYTHLERRGEGELGRAARRSCRALQEEYRQAHAAAQDGLRTDALLGLLPRIEALRRRLRAPAPRGRRAGLRRPAVLGGRAAADEQAGARLLPPPLQGGADRRVPGHRPGPGRARAAPHQRPGARRRLAGASTSARPADRRR